MIKETFEEFSQNYISAYIDLEKGVKSRLAYAMINAARWQKEQDKAIIDGLLEALNEIKYCENRLDYHSDRKLIEFVIEASTKAILKHSKTN